VGDRGGLSIIPLSKLHPAHLAATGPPLAALQEQGSVLPSFSLLRPDGKGLSSEKA
jgi:hypothetical protein